jgi:hypothetical protein
VLKTGATLVRQWRGRTHTVLVREDGFEYEGRRYRSLTVIAERITGAHWSGPRFFGSPLSDFAGCSSRGGLWGLLLATPSAFRGKPDCGSVFPPIHGRNALLRRSDCVARCCLMSYSAAASKLPGSCEAVTSCPSRRHQSSPPSNSLARNPSRASLYAPLVDALQPIPSQ